MYKYRYAQTFLTLDGCSFIGCFSADDGGAIYSLADDKARTMEVVTVKNSKFTDCYSDYGGALFVDTDAHLIIENFEATNCQAVGPDTASSPSSGGAIYCGRLTANKAKFVDCRANVSGGAIYSWCTNAGNVTITNSEAISCTAVKDSAFIYYRGNGMLSITNLICMNCTCDDTDASGQSIYMFTTTGKWDLKGLCVTGCVDSDQYVLKSTTFDDEKIEDELMNGCPADYEGAYCPEREAKRRTTIIVLSTVLPAIGIAIGLLIFCCCSCCEDAADACKLSTMNGILWTLLRCWIGCLWSCFMLRCPSKEGFKKTFFREKTKIPTETDNRDCLREIDVIDSMIELCPGEFES